MNIKAIIKSPFKKFYYIPFIQTRIIQSVSLFKPPVYRRDNMEFDHGLWGGVSALHCVDGRQLGESNTSPRFYRENLPTRLHKGGLDGSRQGYAINLTTLQIVMRHWDDALAVIQFIRKHYIQHFDVQTQRLAMLDLYLLSKACVALPAFLTRRVNNRVVDGDLPAAIASQYKIIAGIFMIVQKMIERGEVSLLQGNGVSAQELYDYAEKHAIFISPNGMACGGSKRKILELMEFAIAGPPLEGELDLASEQRAFIGDPKPILNYMKHAVEMELVILLARAKIAKQFLAINADSLINYPVMHAAWERLLNRIKQSSPDDPSVEGRIDALTEMIYAVLAKLDVTNVEQLESALHVEHAGVKQHLAAIKPSLDLPISFVAALSQACAYYQHVADTVLHYCGERQLAVNEVLAWSSAQSLSAANVKKRLNNIPSFILRRDFKIEL